LSKSSANSLLGLSLLIVPKVMTGITLGRDKACLVSTARNYGTIHAASILNASLN